MEKNINLKILNIISGSNNGGAEAFFERFSISINKERDIEQERDTATTIRLNVSNKKTKT